jgi:hypothetical protein
MFERNIEVKVTPELRPPIDLMYAAVTARRLQWDNLIWQVPLLSLTAQAFLFTIALGGESRQASRIVACLLSLIVTFLCITLMARHRQAEIYDARWLERFEESHWPDVTAVHGRPFRAGRSAAKVDGGWTDRIVPILPGYKTWVTGLLLFGLASAAALITAIVAPNVLASWGH